MRREQFSLETRHLDAGSTDETAPLPTLLVTYDGPEAELRSAFEGANGTQLQSADLDVSLRLTSELDETDPDGVLAVTDRLTGDFVCECNVGADTVFEFLETAKRRAASVDGPPKYRIQFIAGETPIRTDELDTFLVYTESGALRESESLLPNGVQL